MNGTFLTNHLGKTQYAGCDYLTDFRRLMSADPISCSFISETSTMCGGHQRESPTMFSPRPHAPPFCTREEVKSSSTFPIEIVPFEILRPGAELGQRPVLFVSQCAPITQYRMYLDQSMTRKQPLIGLVIRQVSYEDAAPALAIRQAGRAWQAGQFIALYWEGDTNYSIMRECSTSRLSATADASPPDPLKAAQDQLVLRSETPRKRVPTKSILIREDYPPEEPEWSPAEYIAALAVKKFYEMGDADLTQAE